MHCWHSMTRHERVPFVTPVSWSHSASIIITTGVPPCHRFYPSCSVFTPGDGECQVTVTLSHSHIQIGFMPNQKLIICSKCIVHVHYSYNFYKIQPSSIWQSCQTDNCQGVGFRGGTHAHKFLRSIKQYKMILAKLCKYVKILIFIADHIFVSFGVK